MQPTLKNYSFDDLPRFSDWPERLLGLKPFSRTKRTRTKIEREYEVERWGHLQQKIQETNAPLSIKAADQAAFASLDKILYYEHPKFSVRQFADAHHRRLNIIQNTLKEFLPATCVVELGCGYGTIILNLAKQNMFDKSTLIGLEYTQSGRLLTSTIAKAENIHMTVDYCDITARKLCSCSIPQNAVIFTHSVIDTIIPEIPSYFIETISALQPKAVIHFETCYKHYCDNSLFHIMSRRYIDVNDYNRNLLTVLKEKEQQGNIRIIQETPLVFGVNPLFSKSIIVWEPAS